MSIHELTLYGLFALWLALAWLINHRFRLLEERLDDRASALNEQFEGLREYLYEIDPQFAEEVALERDLANGDDFAGMTLHTVQSEKKNNGQRTLRSRFRT